MQETQAPPDLGAVLLAFYECLTDPRQLETLMALLTSWLDDEGGAVVSPKIDYHADQAWRLLGEIAEADYLAATDFAALDITRYADACAVHAAVAEQIRPEDQDRLEDWLATEMQSTALLLRLSEAEQTDLVILSRDPVSGAYLGKRTGAAFQNVISKFVADSFELTHAEFTLVQELLLGGTLREIADRLGKSWETTRSQVKTLTNKLGVSSQADILRMVNQAATLMPVGRGKRTVPKGATLGRLDRPDGRTIVYEVDGSKSDKTLVFLHGMTQGRHWPDKARKYATDRGWRVVRFSRAGRGPSTLNPKENDALLQDHVDDVMAVVNQEGVERFSIFGCADGFAVGYPLALQYPERVHMIVGIEVVPPIVSRAVINGFSGKMKTFGLACRYAPKTIKFMLRLAMHQLDRMEDRYSGVHPLIGMEMSKFEDADGLRVDDLNFQDIMAHKAEGMWRDATYACHDWAYAPPNSNIRPRAALIHCANSMIKRPGGMDVFAQQIGAPIYRIDNYLPYISAALPTVLDAIEAA
ncbi:MAG: hypothetical protein AAFQ64_14890 [Pseudomonadota bacterium]